MNDLKIKLDFVPKDVADETEKDLDTNNGWMNIIKKVQNSNAANLSNKRTFNNTHSDETLQKHTLNSEFYMKDAIQSNISSMNLKQCKNCHKPFKLHDYKEHSEFCERSSEWAKNNNDYFKVDAKNAKKKSTNKKELLNLDSDSDLSKLSPYKKRKLLQQQLKNGTFLKEETSSFSSTAVSTPEKKLPKQANHAPVEEIDFDRQCGVGINNKPGLYCSKPLNCKTHSLPVKKQVQGRSKSYEASLQQYQREVKLQKQQMAKLGTDEPYSSSEAKELMKEQKLQEKKEKLLRKQEEKALVKRMKQEERLKLQQLKKHEKQLKQNDIPANGGLKNGSDSEMVENKLSGKMNKASAQFLLRQQLKKAGKVKKYSREEENNLVMSGLTKALALPVDSFEFTSSKVSSRKFRLKQALYNGLSNNKTYSHLSQKEQSLQTLNVPVYGNIFGKVGLIDVNYPNERLFSENYEMKKVKMIQYHQSVQEQQKREAMKQQALQQQQSQQQTPQSMQGPPAGTKQTPPAMAQQQPASGVIVNSSSPPSTRDTKQPNVTLEQLPKLEQHYKQVFLKYQTLASQQNAANEQQLLQMKQYLTKLQPVIKYLRATKASQEQSKNNQAASSSQVPFTS